MLDYITNILPRPKGHMQILSMSEKSVMGFEVIVKTVDSVHYTNLSSSFSKNLKNSKVQDDLILCKVIQQTSRVPYCKTLLS